jgi:tetratricopeptide (TPR) repeat protein
MRLSRLGARERGVPSPPSADERRHRRTRQVMTDRTLRIEQALRALPEVDDIVPLRSALLGGARKDGERRWSASEAYETLEVRLANLDALAAELPALADAVRARAGAAMEHTLAALRAMEAGDHAGAALALVAAGEVQERAGRLPAAAGFYERARELGRKPRDRRAEGLALRRLGRVARAAGELERSLELYHEGFSVAEAQRDVQGMVVACQGLGNVHVDQGRWPEARTWYVRGVELLPADAAGPERVHLCSAMSAVERRLGRLSESAGWLDRGEEAARRAGDSAGLGYVLNGRGMLHLARGEHALAEAALRQALETDLDPAARTGVMVNLAEPLLGLGRLPDAERVAREAERMAIRHGVFIKLPDVYRTLGAVARARGDAEGFVFFEEALRVCRRHGLPAVELAATQHHYGLFDEATGMRETAAARLRAALGTYRSLGAAVDAERVEKDLARVAGGTDAAGPEGSGTDGGPADAGA